MNSALPPRTMSVPRPAMLVEMVTEPLRPACATICASISWNLALSTLCGMPFFFRRSDTTTDFSTEMVPTSTGCPFLWHSSILGEHRAELALLVLVDEVVHVLADHRLVGRDDHDAELVDLVELLGLGLGGAGHARQLLVHAEVVLEGDGRRGLVLLLDVDVLLGLDGLVQAVGPAASRHLAAGVLVDDDHLAVLDDVGDVALVQACARAAPASRGG
jgi:hypothetical protein